MPRSFIRKLPIRNYLEYMLLHGVADVVNVMPMSISTWLARRIGDMIYYTHGKRRNTVISNLKLAYKNTLGTKEEKRIAQETFRNLATSLMEFFRTESVLKESARRFEFEGTEHLDAALKDGHGVVLAISHIGSWEYLAFLPYLKKYTISVIVRETKNPYVYKWIQDLRTKTGLEPMDRVHSAKKTLKRLKENKVVAVLTDQWSSSNGIWVNFFGTPTSTTAIPARLSLHTGAAIIPAYCLRVSPGQYKIYVKPRIHCETGVDTDVSVTEKLNEVLENEIRKFPEQWSWAHKRWKSYEHYITLKKNRNKTSTGTTAQ